MFICKLKCLFQSILDTVMSTCPAPHMSIGQHGLRGSAAQFHAAVGSSRDDEYARMETNALDAALYVFFILLLNCFVRPFLIWTPQDMKSVLSVNRFYNWNITKN